MFEYVSGSEISTLSGSMEGAFLFEELGSGERFEVEVRQTKLVASR